MYGTKWTHVIRYPSASWRTSGALSVLPRPCHDNPRTLLFLSVSTIPLRHLCSFHPSRLPQASFLNRMQHRKPLRRTSSLMQKYPSSTQTVHIYIQIFSPWYVTCSCRFKKHNRRQKARTFTFCLKRTMHHKRADNLRSSKSFSLVLWTNIWKGLLDLFSRCWIHGTGISRLTWTFWCIKPFTTASRFRASNKTSTETVAIKPICNWRARASPFTCCRHSRLVPWLFQSKSQWPHYSH